MSFECVKFLVGLLEVFAQVVAYCCDSFDLEVELKLFFACVGQLSNWIGAATVGVHTARVHTVVHDLGLQRVRYGSQSLKPAHVLE